jgi:Multiubiquitin
MDTTTITILLNQQHHEAGQAQMTGAQIKELAAIPGFNLLFREVQGPGDDEQIHDQTMVRLRQGDRFYDMPPGNFGS